MNHLYSMRLIASILWEKSCLKPIKILYSRFGIKKFRFTKRKYDLGFSIENIVYFELLRREFRVNIGKFGENEVDFVARKMMK